MSADVWCEYRRKICWCTEKMGGAVPSLSSRYVWSVGTHIVTYYTQINEIHSYCSWKYYSGRHVGRCIFWYLAAVEKPQIRFHNSKTTMLVLNPSANRTGEKKMKTGYGYLMTTQMVSTYKHTFCILQHILQHYSYASYFCMLTKAEKSRVPFLKLI